MKNEGAFLLEWVAHHKALGFDNILICTNDCADHTRRMVFRLQALGLATHHPTKSWPATSIQRSALKQALRYDIVTSADWVYVCDADEFLVIKIGDGSVRALISAATPGTEVISVPWRIFGPGGQSRYTEGRITRQFPKAQASTGPGRADFAYGKSLFAGVRDVARIGIHLPIPKAELGRDFRREDPGGRAHVPQRHPMFVAADYTVAQVNHYALRSAESFLVKRDRGRVNHVGQEMGLDYWARFDLATEPCDAIRRYDNSVDDWMARLLADPDLAFMHRKSVEWHKARIAQLKTAAEHKDIWARIGNGALA